jgi:hypothetical protein
MQTEDDLARAGIRSRGPLLILLGVLMLAILAGVLWASGMNRKPVTTQAEADAGQPSYVLPDNRPSDVASR